MLPDHDFAACRPLNLYSIEAKNHDFAMCSPIDQAALGNLKMLTLYILGTL